MAINDLYHVQVIQTDENTNEDVITNWFYNGVALASAAESLYNGFTEAGGMLDLINAIQSRVLNNKLVRVLNLFSLTDFFEDAPGGQGALADDNMLPLFNGVSITKKVDTRGVRAGRVNIPGIIEAAQTAGLINDANYITDINALVNAMSADINIDADEIYDPVVIKRIKYTVPDSDPARDAYRLPATSGEADYGHVTVAVANLRVAHMVSRGNGR